MSLFKRVDNRKVEGTVKRTSPYDGRKIVMVQSGAIVRLMPEALKALGATMGDRVAVGELGAEGSGELVIAKMKDGKKLDDLGKFSSQYSSQLLGPGKVYEITGSQPDVNEDGTPVLDENKQPVLLHKLTFVETVELKPRAKKGDAAVATTDVVADGEVIDTAVETAPAQEPAQSNGPEITNVAATSEEAAADDSTAINTDVAVDEDEY